jgi:hypothetical protein
MKSLVLPLNAVEGEGTTEGCAAEAEIVDVGAAEGWTAGTEVVEIGAAVVCIAVAEVADIDAAEVCAEVAEVVELGRVEIVSLSPFLLRLLDSSKVKIPPLTAVVLDVAASATAEVASEAEPQPAFPSVNPIKVAIKLSRRGGNLGFIEYSLK